MNTNPKKYDNIKIVDFFILFSAIGAMICFGLIVGEIGLELNYMNTDDTDKFKLYSKIQLGLSSVVLLLSIICIILDYDYPKNPYGKYVIYSFILGISGAIIALSNITNFDNTIKEFNWPWATSLVVGLIMIIFSITGIAEKATINNSKGEISPGSIGGLKMYTENLKELSQLNKMKIAIIVIAVLIIIFLTVWNVIIAPSQDLWPFNKYEFSPPAGTFDKYTRENN